MIRRSRGAGTCLLAALALAGGAAEAAGQEECAPPGPGSGRWAGAVIGGVRTGLAGADATHGVEAGGAAGTRVGSLALAGEVTYTVLTGGPGRPLSLRLRAGHPVLQVRGIRLCAAALGGGSAVSAEPGSAWTVGGGFAMTAARPLGGGAGSLTPYVGVRVLGAHAAGTVLGRDFTAGGAAVGAEAGVRLERGRGVFAARFTADGFDPALGPAAYPDFALRVEARLPL